MNKHCSQAKNHDKKFDFLACGKCYFKASYTGACRDSMNSNTIKEVLSYSLPYSRKKHRNQVLAYVHTFGFQQTISEIQEMAPHLKEEKISDILVDYLML